MGGKLGAMSKLRIGTEDTWGDGHSHSSINIPYTTQDLHQERPPFFPDEARESYKQETVESGVINVRGSFTYAVKPSSVAIPETWALGRTAGQLTNSLAIQVDREVEYVKYNGCYINTLDLACAGADQRLMATVGIEGKEEVADVDWGESYGLETAYHFAHGVFSIGGSVESYVRSFALTINNQCVTDLHGNAYKLVEISQGKRLITGSIVVTLKGTTYTAAWRASPTTELAFSVVFTHPDADTLTITIPKMKLTGPELSIDPTAIIPMTLPFQAKVHGTDDITIISAT